MLSWGRMDVGANQIAYVGGYRSIVTPARVSRTSPYGLTHWSDQVAGSSITSVDLPCDKSEDRKTTRIASSLVNSPRFGIK